MKKVIVQIEPDQGIEFSNGVFLDQKMIETLRKLQLGYDESNPKENDFLNDLQNYLVEAGDALHQLNYQGSITDSHFIGALENLWNVRQALDVFRI